jgi:hypothetical protein
VAIPAHLRIIGVIAVHLSDEGSLSVVLGMSDGSHAATYWPAEDLHRFLTIHENSPKGIPLGAIIQ